MRPATAALCSRRARSLGITCAGACSPGEPGNINADNVRVPLRVPSFDEWETVVALVDATKSRATEPSLPTRDARGNIITMWALPTPPYLPWSLPGDR